MELSSQLVMLCMEAACESRESVEKWRRQKRTLDRLPSQLADALLHRLLERRLLYPSLLEVFKHSAEMIDLRGETSIDAEWMAYLGAFRHLRKLNVADCHRLNSAALWAITGLASLIELDLSRCSKVNDFGIQHLLSISTLQKLSLAETSVTADGVKLLSSLSNLSLLDLGGLPVTDISLSSLQVLKDLYHLDLWGSEISNRGAAILRMFPKLSFLNLAWTSVTRLPNLPSVKHLNLSYCHLDSLFEECADKAPLEKLILSGTTFTNDAEALLYINGDSLSLLDISHSSIQRFSFLLNMKLMEYLNISSAMIGDDTIELVACVGANLKHLNLSGTKVSAIGIAMLAGHVPNLEILILSQTLIDDIAISSISMMPSLKVIDLSGNNVKGLINQEQIHQDSTLSLSALQNLKYLERLNLERTQVRDEALSPLSRFGELNHLSLRSAWLTDVSVSYLSSIRKLKHLRICDAVLTNNALESFKPQATLKVIDLHGCWLLTEEAILSFCKLHPQIEVRHEHVHVRPLDPVGSRGSSPFRSTSKAGYVKKMKGVNPTYQVFMDQRLKYSRDELLTLQHAPRPPASHHDEVKLVSKMSPK